MDLSKDTYLYLMNFADDKTILNMLSVNKKFNDDEFFKKVLERRYPLLIQFKGNKGTWKQFYVKTIYYLSKLKEEYDFPYFPSRHYNPFRLYRKLNKYPENIATEKLALAAAAGDIQMVDKYLDNKKAYPDFGLKHAAVNGNLEIVKLLVEKGKVNRYNLDNAMWEAAKNNHMNVIEYLISKGGRPDPGLSPAAARGDIEMVKYLISKGAHFIKSALQAAASEEQIEMIKFLFPYISKEDIIPILQAKLFPYSQEIKDLLQSLYREKFE